MKKNIISATILLVTALLSASCAKIFQSEQSSEENVTFTSVVDQFGGTSKTALNALHQVEWESTDVVRVNHGFFDITPDEDDATKGTAVFNGNGWVSKHGPFTAYYPSTLYDDKKLTLPQTQVYSEGSISNNPMYAYSKWERSLLFHNLCGLVEFTLKGTAKVKKIVVAAEAGGLSGEFTVVDNKAVLTDEAKEANKGVTLDCGTGAQLNKTDGVIPIPENPDQTLLARDPDVPAINTATEE